MLIPKRSPGEGGHPVRLQLVTALTSGCEGPDLPPTEPLSEPHTPPEAGVRPHAEAGSAAFAFQKGQRLLAALRAVQQGPSSKEEGLAAEQRRKSFASFASFLLAREGAAG